jgi:hypothetical protein
MVKSLIAIAEFFSSGHTIRFTAAGAVIALAVSGRAEMVAQPASPPHALRDTGLYTDWTALKIDPRHFAFAPQYPLWTDGAVKRRWISLPPGAAIDGSDPDAWIFPAGTRFWKEFSFSGQRVETRYMERKADGHWLYAAYTWSPDGHEALLTPEKGKRGAYALAGGRTHAIPSVSDCKVCHQGGRTEVLGFSMLQLSRDRDPDALHSEPRPSPGVDLNDLVKKGLLFGIPNSLLETPPRIAAASAMERAALGYMHGNCGHCHNNHGSLKNVGLFLRDVFGAGMQTATASTIGYPVKKPAPGQSPDAVLRIDPGHPDRSGLMQRIASRYAPLQMPPLGTELVDKEAVALIHRWISGMDESARNVPQE